MRLLSLQDADTASTAGVLPQPVEADFRGVALHWVTEAPIRGKRRRFNPKAVVPSWAVQRVRFGMLNHDGSDRPPASQVEADRMVRHAYAFAACHHPIPSDVIVWYEVRG